MGGLKRVGGGGFLTVLPSKEGLIREKGLTYVFEREGLIEDLFTVFASQLF